jgi:hypothetical protein
MLVASGYALREDLPGALVRPRNGVPWGPAKALPGQVPEPVPDVRRYLMNGYLIALGACLVLVLLLLAGRRRRGAAAARAPLPGPTRRFAYDLTQDEGRIVRRLLEHGEEEAAASVITSYYHGDIEPGDCRTILDHFRNPPELRA